MDDIFSIIFLMWVMFTIVEGVALNKKRKLPTLEETTPIEQIELPVIKSVTERQLEVPEVKSTSSNQKEVPKSKLPAEVSTSFTADDVLNAIVYAEIFSKPKALRK